MKVTTEEIEQVLRSSDLENLSFSEIAERIEDLFYEHKSVCRIPAGSLTRLLFNDNQTLLRLLKTAEQHVKDLESDLVIMSDLNANLKFLSESRQEIIDKMKASGQNKFIRFDKKKRHDVDLVSRSAFDDITRQRDDLAKHKTRFTNQNVILDLLQQFFIQKPHFFEVFQEYALKRGRTIQAHQLISKLDD